MNTPTDHPAALPDLAAFWALDETAGEARQSLGAGPALVEAAGPMTTEPGGVFGARVLRVQRGQWLEVPRAKLGALDIHGPRAEVTLAAWFRRDHPEHWQAVAGLWDESRDKRQYCLFAHARLRTLAGKLERVPCGDRLHAHASDVGGPTPGRDFCHTYATGATPAHVGEWCQATLVYRRGMIELWRDGRLDQDPESNPLPMPKGLFDGGSDGAAFAVGANSVRGAMGNFFEGLIAGVGVWRRALKPDELESLATPLAQLRKLHPAAIPTSSGVAACDGGASGTK